MVVVAVIALALIAAGLLALWLAVLSHRNRWAQRLPVAPPPPPARPRRQIRTEVPHLLYAYDWVTGGPCYGGISNEPPARDARHAIDPDDQWWYQRSTKVMRPIAWYPNRRAAQAAERTFVREATARGAYLANDHHNPNRRGSRALRP